MGRDSGDGEQKGAAVASFEVCDLSSEACGAALRTSADTVVQCCCQTLRVNLFAWLLLAALEQFHRVHS
jgi:hypothetical protein